MSRAITAARTPASLSIPCTSVATLVLPLSRVQISKQETQKWFVDKYEGVLLN